jgi:carbon-monoxide dehydrogenase large subunit
VDDVLPPGTLHAAFVRSQVAHGRLVNVDAEPARQSHGVVAVFTGEEMEKLILPPGAMGLGVDSLSPAGGPSYTVLCTDKVRVVGDPIVMVLAESRSQAEDACELVEVDVDDLPAVTSAPAALDPDSAVIFEDLGSNVIAHKEPVIYGDVDGAFARADRVVQARISSHRHQNVPIEGRGIVASFDPASGRLTVTSATRRLHLVRSMLAARLGLEPEQVRLVVNDIGGAFGLKFASSREELAVAAASKHLERPVKWIEDRSENLIFSGQAREESLDVEAAVTTEGDILALKVRMLRDAGAYPGLGPGIDLAISRVLPGPYKLEGLSFGSTLAVTNKASYIPYRAPWAAETYVRERMIDLISRELGLDPLQVRLRNVVTRDEPPLQMVTGRSLAGVTARESMERIAELVDFAEFRRHQHDAREEGRLLGIGIASYVESGPGPRGAGDPPLGAENARARLDADGTVVLTTGQMPHGQSHYTTLAQVVADQMGVPFEQVRIELGDTDVAPPGATGGSLAATMAGGAALTVSRELRERVLEVASELLEASPEDLDIVAGRVAVKGVPSSAISLAEVASASREGRLPPETDTALEVTIVYDGGQGGWSGGTHCAEVEIEPGTGAVEVLRYVVVSDCGEIINPAIVEGQIRGAVAQAIGAVLLERSVYDEYGQCLTGSLMDYVLPTATTVPAIEIDHLETVPVDEHVNFRGIGEGGMVVGPATLCNAIEDALSHLGVRLYEQYLPPTRILELIGTIETEPTAV